jgi:predicted aminopeptidase
VSDENEEPKLREMADRWRREVAARMAAERYGAELSAAFKKIVKRWRDELDDLLAEPARCSDQPAQKNDPQHPPPSPTGDT